MQSRDDFKETAVTRIREIGTKIYTRDGKFIECHFKFIEYYESGELTHINMTVNEKRYSEGDRQELQFDNHAHAEAFAGILKRYAENFGPIPEGDEKEV